MLDRSWFRSIYFKTFLSFLATCILFFIGLAVFWNYYFTDLFYKDKKELLQSRYTEVIKLLTPSTEGTASSREIAFGVRIIGRSINGQIWLVDSKGNLMMNESTERNLPPLPKGLEVLVAEGLKGNSGFKIHQLGQTGQAHKGILTYYAPAQYGGQPIVVFLNIPVDEISEAISAVRWNIVVPLLFSLVAVGVILFVISRKFARPLQQMNKVALDLADGDFTARVPVTSHDELGQLAESFNIMVDRLLHWEDTRQEFLANVSHELRSPLTTLRGFIVAMNDGLIPQDRYPHYLSICDAEVQRLQRLVHDLLDLARIQNEVGDLRVRPILVERKVKEVLDLLHSTFDQKGVKLKSTLSGTEAQPLVAMLDPDRFAQILQNLLYNALQFTPEGGEVEVTAALHSDQVVVTVSDTGIGMSEEDLEKIWDRFYKADPSRSVRSDGTGLGLTIVKHLADRMNGTVRVESKRGEGSWFTVSFPAAKAGDASI